MIRHDELESVIDENGNKRFAQWLEGLDAAARYKKRKASGSSFRWDGKRKNAPASMSTSRTACWYLTDPFSRLIHFLDQFSPKPSGGVELGRPEFLLLAQHRVIRCVVQVFRHLSAEPPEDAVGGGVDLFVVLCHADLAVLGHRLLLFYPTIGLGPR